MKRLALAVMLSALLSFLMASEYFDSETLTDGLPAPAIGDVIIEDGTTLDLDKALAKGTVLVYFYPKADTPGCTKQACSLRDGWSELQNRGVTVYGVSRDKPKAQQAFIEKYELPFSLIADTDGRVHKALDVPRFGRRAYLFQDGVLVWHDLKAATTEQADDVLAALEALGSEDGE